MFLQIDNKLFPSFIFRQGTEEQAIHFIYR